VRPQSSRALKRKSLVGSGAGRGATRLVTRGQRGKGGLRAESNLGTERTNRRLHETHASGACPSDATGGARKSVPESDATVSRSAKNDQKDRVPNAGFTGGVKGEKEGTKNVGPNGRETHRAGKSKGDGVTAHRVVEPPKPRKKKPPYVQEDSGLSQLKVGRGANTEV